jgi:predicted nucleotidyltransferase
MISGLNRRAGYDARYICGIKRLILSEGQKMPRKRPRKIDQVLAEAKAMLTAQFSHRLKGIVLFGSYARGDFTTGSDIDLLVLLHPFESPEAERKRIFPAVCDLSLKYDTVLSIVLMDFEIFRSRKTPLILNAGKEGAWI